MKILGCLLFILLTSRIAEAFLDHDDVPTTDQISAWHGYSAEKHEVTTEDNYTLGVFRIIGATNCTARKAVILAHGILSSSTDWIITGSDNAFAYLLADTGYDVWLMNFRGNRYSRKHLYYTPKDDEFWNFSWHEMGMYDIPSVVDHVLKTGEAEKVTLVCHSMGCTSLLVTLSERPEYNQKIESAHLMAPISVLGDTSPILNSTKGVVNTLEDGHALFGPKEVSSRRIKKLWGELCLGEKINPIICSCPIFLITGWRSYTFEIPPYLWEAIYHQQGGLSSKTLIHYIQVANAGRLQKFNYKEEESIFLHEHKIPPSYIMRNVLVPVYIYFIKSDVTAGLRDVYQLSSSLPNVMEMSMVFKEIDHHMDFLWKKGIRNNFYNGVIKEMNEHGQETDSQCHLHRGGDGARPAEEAADLPVPQHTTISGKPESFHKITSECEKTKDNLTEDIRENVNNHGYPLEYHAFMTEDGYVLGVHRIPPNDTITHDKKPYPVILVHGALMTSFSWLVMGPNKSLGYRLADSGYDVWMVNHRGNSMSKIHRTLPKCSREFWDFSWHEMGKFDLPAMIDYIISITKMEKVDIVGYSLGANIMAVMGSTRPEYNAKVNVMHLIAPSILMTRVEPKLKLLAYLSFSDVARYVMMGEGHELKASHFGKMVSSKFCKLPLLYKMCTIVAYVFYGFNEEKHDEEELALYLKHIPDGSSMKTMVHLAQITLSGYFHLFDMYERNLEVYGTPWPPSYNFSTITAKVRIYYSSIDEGVSLDGLFMFAEQLPALIGMHETKDFRHQDYLFPLNKQLYQYDEIIENMESDR